MNFPEGKCLEGNLLFTGHFSKTHNIYCQFIFLIFIALRVLGASFILKYECFIGHVWYRQSSQPIICFCFVLLCFSFCFQCVLRLGGEGASALLRHNLHKSYTACANSSVFTHGFSPTFTYKYSAKFILEIIWFFHVKNFTFNPAEFYLRGIISC